MINKLGPTDAELWQEHYHDLEAKPHSLERVVETPAVDYCETVEQALAAGWLNPYEGGKAADGWKGRIYGRRPGNHRIFRCTKRLNSALTKLSTLK